MKTFFLITTLALIGFPTLGKEQVIENHHLKVSVGSSGNIKVLDKQSGTVWKQNTPDAKGLFAVKRMAKSTRSISFELGAQPKAKVKLTLANNAPDLLFEMSAVDASREMPENIRFPYPFLPPSDEAEMVIPNRSGALYPVTKRIGGPKPWKIGGKELLMSWYGIVDENLESGMIAVIDTPYDAEMVFAEDNKLTMPVIEWLPSMGKLNGTRRIIFHFSAQGGYVPLAKYYRNYKIRTGEFITLREKVKQNPEVAKLIGGINARILHDYKGLSKKYLTKLPEYGIIKGSLCVRAKDDKDGLITAEVVNTLSKQGFLLTHWCSNKWVIENADNPLHPQYMENPNVVLTKDMMTFSKSELKGKEGKDGKVLLCGTSCAERIDQFIERCNEHYPIKPKGFSPTGSLKIDTLCGDVYECYDPQHPLSRKETIEHRVEMLKGLKKKGFVLSAEGGDDWGVPYLDTAYGPLALQRVQGRSIKSASWSIQKPVDPKIGPLYDEYYFGPKHRVPLFDLVYHDCIVTTFHDGDSNNMYYKTEAEDQKYWRLKELYQILHGQAPNFYLTVDAFFEEQHGRIKESIQTVCTWHEQVAYDELVDHRYLSDDRMVQETRFSSGSSVIVNFNTNKPYRTKQGTTIKPLGYLTGSWE